MAPSTQTESDRLSHTIFVITAAGAVTFVATVFFYVLHG